MYIQLTPDNSNLQGNRKSSSYREFELSRVKLYRKRSEGKCKLQEVRVIEGSSYRDSTVSTAVIVQFRIKNYC